MGGKEFWSKATGCKVLMFYPVDAEEYAKKISEKTWDIFRFPGREEAAIKSMVHAMLPKKVPAFGFRPQTTIQADVCEDADLSKNYKLHSNFRPIIFSHGNKSSPSDYTGLFSEYASRGFIVFAPFH